MSDYLSAAHYLPHAAPMVLLDRVIAVSDDGAHCQVRVSHDGVLAPFLDAQGQLPAWFGVEIIAQTVGVWSGWHGLQADGATPQPGMLLGGRGYRAQQSCFSGGALLDVQVKLLMRDDKIASFEGQIFIDGEPVAAGRLNTYQPDRHELQQLLQQDLPS